MANSVSIKEMLARFSLSPNQALGQNFLADAAKAQAIAGAACAGGYPILEIGPGLGALTEPLLDRAPRVCAVELDRAMVQVLDILFQGRENFTLIQGDFLKADLAAVSGILGGPFSVAGNLPYYATTPICLRLLGTDLPIMRMALMTQTEAAERFTARPGSRQYGPLAVLSQYYFHPETFMDLSPADYYPQPDVNSRVTLFQRRAGRAFCPGFLPFLQQAFSMRRKTLRNNLKNVPHARETLAEAGLLPTARAEELDVESLAALYQSLVGCRQG